jgi:hypothetical protein
MNRDVTAKGQYSFAVVRFNGIYGLARGKKQPQQGEKKGKRPPEHDLLHAG